MQLAGGGVSSVDPDRGVDHDERGVGDLGGGDAGQRNGDRPGLVREEVGDDLIGLEHVEGQVGRLGGDLGAHIGVFDDGVGQRDEGVLLLDDRRDVQHGRGDERDEEGQPEGDP